MADIHARTAACGEVELVSSARPRCHARHGTSKPGDLRPGDAIDGRVPGGMASLDGHDTIALNETYQASLRQPPSKVATTAQKLTCETLQYDRLVRSHLHRHTIHNLPLNSRFNRHRRAVRPLCNLAPVHTHVHPLLGVRRRD